MLVIAVACRVRVYYGVTRLREFCDELFVCYAVVISYRSNGNASWNASCKTLHGNETPDLMFTLADKSRRHLSRCRHRKVGDISPNRPTFDGRPITASKRSAIMPIFKIVLVMYMLLRCSECEVNSIFNSIYSVAGSMPIKSDIWVNENTDHCILNFLCLFAAPFPSTFFQWERRSHSF